MCFSCDQERNNHTVEALRVAKTWLAIKDKLKHKEHTRKPKVTSACIRTVENLVCNINFSLEKTCSIASLTVFFSQQASKQLKKKRSFISGFLQSEHCKFLLFIKCSTPNVTLLPGWLYSLICTHSSVHWLPPSSTLSKCRTLFVSLKCSASWSRVVSAAKFSALLTIKQQGIKCLWCKVTCEAIKTQLCDHCHVISAPQTHSSWNHLCWSLFGNIWQPWIR